MGNCVAFSKSSSEISPIIVYEGGSVKEDNVEFENYALLAMN